MDAFLEFPESLVKHNRHYKIAIGGGDFHTQTQKLFIEDKHVNMNYYYSLSLSLSFFLSFFHYLSLSHTHIFTYNNKN